MIVDDEAILRTGIHHLCNWNEYGISIVADASNGKEALQLIDSVQPHVVITDVVMPVMDGVEFAKIMQKKYPHIKIIVLSSYSEFDYVREAFKYGVTDYLLKPKVSAPELVQLIRSLCSAPSDPPVRSQQPEEINYGLLIHQMLNHMHTDPSEWADKLAARFPYEQLRLLKCSSTLQLSKSGLTQTELERSLIQLAKEHLAPIDAVCFFQHEECALLLNYKQADDKLIVPAVDAFARYAKQAMPHLTFVMSNSFPSFAYLKACSDRLSVCLSKMIYYPHKHWIAETEVSIEQVKIEFDTAAFTASINHIDFLQTRSIVKAFFLQAKTTCAYDDYSLKRFCQNLIYTIMSAMDQLHVKSTQFSSSKIRLFKTIDLAADLHELETIILQLLQEAETIIMEQGDSRHRVLLQRISQYIEENYDQDLSLTDLAEHFHLSYSYLSSYFKQQTNENLTTYINKVRIEKAKQLLLNWDLSISEVNRMTGFSEHNYFSKVFKKITGQTPVEYRSHL